MFVQASAEGVGTVLSGYEIEQVVLFRIAHGQKRGQAGRGNGSGRQAGVDIGVVRVAWVFQVDAA